MRLHIPVLLIFSIALCSPHSARADAANAAGITFFRTDVTVKEDATLEVREEISVGKATSFYKFGFMRDLPIDSQDRWDRRYVGEYKRDNGIRVNILEVTQDGHPAKYEQGSGYGYSQLRIGEKDVPLDSGEHRFVIRYTVDSALTLGAARDVLYWNSNGHERNAPIAEAILAVHLSPAISPESIEVEPRVAGRGVSYPRRPETTLDRIDNPSASITYRATNVGPRQSLSLVVSWPAGFIHQPKLHALGRDQWMFAAPALLLLYYLIAWFWIGPEPKPGTIVARYEPPDGLSAAAVRYITTGGSDGRSLAAVIAELGVRGCLRVEPSNGKYKLSRLMGDRAVESQLAPEEKSVLAAFFEDGPVLEISPSMEQRNSAINSRYVARIQRELQKNLAGKYFVFHFGVIMLGVLFTIVSALVLASMAQGRDASGSLFFTTWALGAGLMIGLLFEVAFLPACKAAKSSTGLLKLLPGLAALAVFASAIVYMLHNLAVGVSPAFAWVVAALIFVNLASGPRLKRTTPLGRQVLDEIAGFRQFLQKAEQDRLNRINPSGESLERSLKDSNRFLSYAIALEVKETWGDHLAQAFFATTVMRDE